MNTELRQFRLATPWVIRHRVAMIDETARLIIESAALIVEGGFGGTPR